MKQPYIGAIVHVVLGDPFDAEGAGHRPGIVTALPREGVKDDGPMIAVFIGDGITEYRMGYDDGHKHWSWHWPEEATP